MKRRKFISSLVAAPVAGTAVASIAAGQTAATTKPGQQPPPQPNTPARQVARQPPSIPKLAVTQADLTSDAELCFFTDDQFSALQQLAAILVPPIKGAPGAVDAGAPQFLDFLLSVSPGDRQKLYRDGLDGLNARSHKQHHKAFAHLERPEVDALIRPLLVVRPWPLDLPKDPMENFMAQVHEDLRTATVNSRAAAEAKKSSSHPARFDRSVGYYWKPIDPVVRS